MVKAWWCLAQCLVCLSHAFREKLCAHVVHRQQQQIVIIRPSVFGRRYYAVGSRKGAAAPGIAALTANPFAI